jgi:signal transduction histidine kinase
MRHGKGSRIEVRLQAEPSDVLLSVRDDRLGFRADSRVEKGLGLRTMRHRASALGGPRWKLNPGLAAVVTSAAPYR